MKLVKEVLDYLRKNKLKLVTAESCTAGQILALLGEHEDAGESLEAGYVVYSAEAKKKILGVKQSTIDKFSLSSEEVACEMIKGLLKKKEGTIGIAITGLIGAKPMDGILPGTICMAWGVKNKRKIIFKSETVHLKGPRKKLQLEAARLALEGLMPFYNDIISA